MKLYIIPILLSITLLMATSCNTDNKEVLDNKVKSLSEDGIMITKTCITDIKILYPNPETEAPDIVEFYISSTDSSLNHTLRTKTIESLLFSEGSQSGGEESRFGSGVSIKELKKNHFKLYYTTSHFRGYPVDTVEEKGSDFINTAQLVIINKDSDQWIIKTCSQIP